MAVKTLFSHLFCLAAFLLKFTLFYSLNMLVPTIKTEEPTVAMEMEEATRVRLMTAKATPVHHNIIGAHHCNII